ETITTQTPVVYFSDQSVGANAWEYIISDGSSFTTADFVHEFADPGEYTVTQITTNSFGCTDTLITTLQMDPTLIVFIPNAFTPDGDGINEVFLPVVSGTEVSDYTFRIFNRWGEVIFETTEMGKGWIGNVKGGGHYAKDGVYVYEVIVESDELRDRQRFVGHVTLLR
ncbi:MAG: hypothetical protein RL226_1009, partial [Bacteroidota bacterium]